MGKGIRDRPLRLAEKLKQVREGLHLSQDGMLIRLCLDNSRLTRNDISKFETGKNEPSLPVLYAYAKTANIYLEVLVDDDLDLPTLIPCNEKSTGRKRRSDK